MHVVRATETKDNFVRCPRPQLKRRIHRHKSEEANMYMESTIDGQAQASNLCDTKKQDRLDSRGVCHECGR